MKSSSSPQGGKFHFDLCERLVGLGVSQRLLCSPSAEENVFAAFRPSLCSMVFSALAESNASLQVTATSVLALLAQQDGEWSAVKPHAKV